MNDLLTQNEIEALVKKNFKSVVGQEIIDNIVETKSVDKIKKKVIKCPDIPWLKGSTYYQGKVRANFYGGKLVTKDGVPLRVLVTTGNLSTHGIVRGVVPFKDQVTSELSNYMFDLIKDTLPNSQLIAEGIVAVSEQCVPIDFEVVLRKYIAKSTTTTSLYYHYFILGEREFCGHNLLNDLIPNGKLPYIMDTPSTKARDLGHDTSVSPKHLFDNNIVTSEEYKIVNYSTIEAFGIGEAILKQRGIILVDTKFEVGRSRDGRIKFIDEALTLDTSRYWLVDDYEEKIAKGENPISYSKQIARDFGEMPDPLTDEQRFKIACRYIETYQLLTGKRFIPDIRDARQKIIDDVNKCLDALLN